MIRQLVDGQEALVRTSRNVFPTAEKALGQLTIDLRTMRMQVYDKDDMDDPKPAGVGDISPRT
jgi:starvation-inducible DNA-binding protein